MNDDDDGGEKNRPLYTCGFCHKSWRKKNVYLKHLDVCRGDGSLPNHRCPRCMKTFTYALEMRRTKIFLENQTT